jgi:uncharacterized protein YqjF (DUF2071 family)
MRNFIKHTLFPSLNMKLTLVQRSMIGVYFLSLAAVPVCLMAFASTLLYVAYDALK